MLKLISSLPFLDRRRGSPSILVSGYRWRFSSGVRQPESEAGQLRPYSDDIRNAQTFTSTDHIRLSDLGIRHTDKIIYDLLIFLSTTDLYLHVYMNI